MADTNIYNTDPSFIRAKLVSGEESPFIMNIDSNLKIIARPQLRDGVIEIDIFAAYTNKQGSYAIDDPVTIELPEFIENSIK